MKIGVIGGGISGLSTAYYLSKFGLDTAKKHQIELFEASGRVGGWIKSDAVNLPNGGSLIFERGPRTLRPQGIDGYVALQLVKELGLFNKIVAVSTEAPAAKNRYLLDGSSNRIYKLPQTLPALLYQALAGKHPLLRKLLYALLADIFSAVKQRPTNFAYNEQLLHEILNENSARQTIKGFASNILGEDLAEEFVQAIIGGIFAGDISILELESCFPLLAAADRLRGKGSLILQLQKMKRLNDDLQADSEIKSFQKANSVYTFKHGLETLPKALLQHLDASENVNLNVNMRCKSLSFSDNRAIVEFTNGTSATFDHLIACLPAEILASCLTDLNPVKNLLSSFQSATVVVANVALKKSISAKYFDGFGYLVPGSLKASTPLLGCIFDSAISKNEHCHNITAMLGGYKNKLIKHPVEQHHISEIVTSQVLRQHLNIKNEDPILHFESNAHVNCIPQYNIGHYSCVAAVRKELEKYPVTLHHASYDSVGINSLICQSKNIAQQFS